MRRRGLKFIEQIVDKIAEGLSKKLTLQEQIDQLIEIFAREPNLTIKQAIKKLEPKLISESELDKITLEKMRLFDIGKVFSDEAYRKLVVPKIVGEILKALNYSLEGKRVVEKINNLIEQEEGRIGKD
jgi:Glu-tRNA(Gln) amidotransferase subunit E-like FAD-binding protein